jgi:hypothetical protein
VGISRQAMRKLMLAHRATFPMPVHEGSALIWHLAEVLDWLKMRGGYQFDAGMVLSTFRFFFSSSCGVIMLVGAVDIVAYPHFRKACRCVISTPANQVRL